jgi:hypothetical protein
MATPRLESLRMIAYSSATSCSASAAVGSSIWMMRES